MTRAIAFAAALSVTLSQAPRSAASEQPTVVIVTSSAVDAFAEAVEGVRHGLGPGVRVVMVDLAGRPDNGALASQLGGRDTRLLVTVGNNALEAAVQFGAAPVIATMILRADLAPARPRSPLSAVVLDLPLADVLSRLEKVFPGKTRVGVIRNPAASGPPLATLLAQAKAASVTLRVVDCPRPDRLLQSFLSLRDKVDFVWCPPDSTLYNSTTVKPLILASLENQLPVVGFSASFVRAGAVAGVYPDYYEVGSQAGELAHKYLAGTNVTANEGPRKLKVAANAHVARLLGLRPIRGSEPAAGFVVVE